MLLQKTHKGAPVFGGPGRNGAGHRFVDTGFHKGQRIVGRPGKGKKKTTDWDNLSQMAQQVQAIKKGVRESASGRYKDQGVERESPRVQKGCNQTKRKGM